MFTQTPEQIFTLKALKNAFGEISSKARGLDGVSLNLFPRYHGVRGNAYITLNC